MSLRVKAVAFVVPLFMGIGLVPGQERLDRRPTARTTHIEWLERESMLYQAGESAAVISGRGKQWRHQFGKPQPREAVRRASVWLLDYPGSVITRPGRSVISTWGEPRLWQALHELGVDLLHTGPLNRAGGIKGREYTPTQDGWFDRISLQLDPDLGTEREYARMVAVAAEYEGVIAGDLVPLHTGFGADFQLAQMAYRDYPGLYTMVEIAEEDWELLPEVQEASAVTHVPKAAARELTRLGYLPGLINSNDAADDAREWSGWSATGPVRGVDGRRRRWVYLHYFKPSQPALNWSDPSFAAQRVVIGDAVRTVVQRRTPVVRLDAVPFLGIEPQPGTTESLHFQHPLSINGTNTIAFSVRKLGGWSFQELNVPLERLKDFTKNGPDLSYDFFTRAQCLHALLTGNAASLRLSFRWLLESDVQPISLIHDLQNHDEITYQLVELKHRQDERVDVAGRRLTMRALREEMLEQMRNGVAGDAAPYNRLYRPEEDGIATTFVGYIAPALGVKNPYDATEREIERIRRGHLLLAAANALQPGVFCLSSWDLVGALPIPEEKVQDRTQGGDWRWINRGGVDLLGAAPDASTSAFGLPRARQLYGSLPEQLRTPRSFASRLKRLLAARRKARLADAELVAVPEPDNTALCLLLMRTHDKQLALTVLNFGQRAVKTELKLDALERAADQRLDSAVWTDLMAGDELEESEFEGRLRLHAPPLSGTVYVADGGQSSRKKGQAK